MFGLGVATSIVLKSLGINPFGLDKKIYECLEKPITNNAKHVDYTAGNPSFHFVSESGAANLLTNGIYKSESFIGDSQYSDLIGDSLRIFNNGSVQEITLDKSSKHFGFISTVEGWSVKSFRTIEGGENEYFFLVHSGSK